MSAPPTGRPQPAARPRLRRLAAARLPLLQSPLPPPPAARRLELKMQARLLRSVVAQQLEMQARSLRPAVARLPAASRPARDRDRRRGSARSRERRGPSRAADSQTTPG